MVALKAAVAMIMWAAKPARSKDGVERNENPSRPITARRNSIQH
jgi:hypothetical protein